MNGRRVCQLLLLASALALGIGGTDALGHGGAFYHGGGGWSGGGSNWGGSNWNSGGSGGGSWGGYHGGGWGGSYHGGYYYRGGYYRGYYYRGGGGCCGWSVGFYFGPGFVYGYPYPYYPYPYSYYWPYWPYWSGGDYYGYGPAQYIEQGQGSADETGGAAAPQMAYWYHCANPEGYYPYVKSCPGGWVKVPAQPPGG